MRFYWAGTGRAPDIYQGAGTAVCAPKLDGKVHIADEKGRMWGVGTRQILLTRCSSLA